MKASEYVNGGRERERDGAGGEKREVPHRAANKTIVVLPGPL